MKYVILIIVILLAGSTLVACGGKSAETKNGDTPTPSSTKKVEPVREKLSPVEVFAAVSPAVAFIETPSGTGSGLLFDDEYIVTCAHVVWPFPEVRVVFPDGTEKTDAPVLGWDLIGDLAVIGPIHTQTDPLPLMDGEGLAIGSDVYLIGYPLESESYPQPAISQGILSRLRQWEPIEMTYLQTSADIDFGQSGGVLVSEFGEVIGISGFAFGEVFALPASAKDIAGRVEGIIDGNDVDGLGDRTLPIEGGKSEHQVRLDNFWDEQMFVINEPSGTKIEIEVTSSNDAVLWITDMYGQALAEVNSGSSGMEAVSYETTEWDIPCFFTIGQYSEFTGGFEITASCDLTPFNDPDDGNKISPGETTSGNIDYPGDFDFFILHLDAGETVEIGVDSVQIDPYLVIDFPGALEDEIAADDDSGGGTFGTNSRLVYEAPHTDDFLISVIDAYGSYYGGYYLTVTSGG